MSEAITWTIRFDNNTLDIIFKIMSGLHRDGRQPKSNINTYVRVDVRIRDQIIEFLEQINYLEKQQGRTPTYGLTSNGLRYYNACNNPNDDEYRILHSALYTNILHYRYAYDYIITKEFFEFNKLQFLETMVSSSSNDFGTRIYDYDSAMNVLGFMEAFNVLEFEKGNYSLNGEYKSQFNDDVFLKLIKNRLKNDNFEETRTLCEYLFSNYYKFVSNVESISIEFIYNQLLPLFRENVIIFAPGIPKPPIPSNHTLVKLKE